MLRRLVSDMHEGSLSTPLTNLGEFFQRCCSLSGRFSYLGEQGSWKVAAICPIFGM